MGLEIEMAKPKIQVTPIVIDCEVARRVRQHAHSHMKTEVCGVLIGSSRDGAVHVDACIAGQNASQAGTHVTFTQDTWEHIYKVKDAEYPEARIVGWYHSHPGFGVFLSDHDTFIHRNFFSAPEQFAWVYDPHSEEEGFFGWSADRIERVARFSFTDPRGGEECSETHRPEPDLPAEDELDEPVESHAISMPPAWLRWTASILSHLTMLVLGLLIAWFIFPRLLLVPVPVDPRTGVPLIDVPAGSHWARPDDLTGVVQPRNNSGTPPANSQKQVSPNEGHSAQ
jgi:proteasome lid subunit RPN8/RPN11